MLEAYLFRFAMGLVGAHASPYMVARADSIVAEVAATDGTPDQDLQLVEIAWAESNFNRRAIGRQGERGAGAVSGVLQIGNQLN